MNKSILKSEGVTDKSPGEVIIATETILVPNVNSESFEDWKARKLRTKSKYA